MKKISLLFLFIFCFGLAYINAESEEDFESIYLNGDYKETTKALDEANVYFKKDILLPTRLPGIVFTHVFGRFSTIGYPKLEITFLNENIGKTHYKIFVTSLKHKQDFQNEENIIRMKLKDGSEGIYLTKQNFSILTFEKNEFQYTLMVDNNHQITNKNLIQIADSIN